MLTDCLTGIRPKPRTVKGKPWPGGISFGRGEWSGAFGDIGTDLPLLVGVILVSGMGPGRVLLVFGLAQILSGLVYRMPMPVQPLKVVAVLVMAQGLQGNVIAGGGLAIGVVMLALTLTGALDFLARLVPVPVVRGIQCGLGVKLALLAAGDYVIGHGAPGILMAFAAVLLLPVMTGRPKIPASLALLALGAAAAWLGGAANGAGWQLPPAVQPWSLPSTADIWAGFILLALPQIPLSLGNSVLATRELAMDWFPEARVSAKKIGFTYSLFNIAIAFVGGVPVCHGAGGIAGHYAFGARTGGSVIVYGGFFALLGACALLGLGNVLALFPLPILGVILAREGLALMGRVRGLGHDPAALATALLVCVLAVFLANGFLAGMVAGTLFFWACRRMSMPGAALPETETE
ncbi:MAG: transporter [Candidatus Hydrogenedentes bacterium]|nr:transporter [Candidatus Hydrogenedentota bacterium]